MRSAQTRRGVSVPVDPEFISPLGRKCYATPATGEEMERLLANQAKARVEYEKNPDDVAAIIAYGRATAYLWKYHDAIAIYSKGIENHPDEAMLYRHRGHRYISIREFNLAEDDFARAAALKDDDFDIWYHLGLSRWLKGDYAGAEAAYWKCREVSPGEDRTVAVTYWLYLTLMFAGKDIPAMDLIRDFRPTVLGENAHYYHVLELARGEKTGAELDELMKADRTAHATMGFGVACLHLLQGRAGEARRYLDLILQGEHWSAFGFIAAEAMVVSISGAKT
jgi:tetratricopeptide (TPR) repeat protein